MSNDNKIIQAGSRFGGSNAPVPPAVKLTPTEYHVHFKDGKEKIINGYLGVSPLFVAVTDEHEKILFMVPHSDYAFVEAVIEEEIEVVLDEPDEDEIPF